MRRRLFLIALGLAGCGFTLRGAYTLPWETFAIALPEYSELYQALKRAIESTARTRVVSDAKAAQATLVVLKNEQAKSILSITAQGLVREFLLTRSFSFVVRDAQGRDLTEPVALVLTREMTFDDARIFAKEAEEALLWRNLQADLVQQVMRRLAALNTKAAG
ncbi:MAG: LPS assembly lipoprotein LptE [Rhodocyclaceae bacterium]|nr:LPS assembly lipoprotein LptE [Rhodocyclaceae bacterium]